MAKKILVILFIGFITVSHLSAQELTYGFKAGLNFSSIRTSDIESVNGMDLESYDSNSGFHLGVVVNNKFTDIFGVRGEFLFSQKGGRYSFNGSSYTTLNSSAGESVVRNGIRDMNINISNAYIDIPLSVYVRPISWLELSAGVNVAILISSSAAGEMSFTVEGQAEDDGFKGISLDYRYFSDEIGEAETGVESEFRIINGTTFELPKTLKAYYDYPAGAETGHFNRLDFGVHAGANFFINKSLFVGARINYGLTDITNNSVDRSLVERAADKLIIRDDKDQNFSIQASIGFSF